MSNKPKNEAGRLPFSLRVEADQQHAGCFRLVDKNGRQWANAIPGRMAASVLAAAPHLLMGLDSALDHLGEVALAPWDIPFSGPDLVELAEDGDGTLEEAYPGAPAMARWLLMLDEIRAAAGATEGSWPLFNDKPMQLELPFNNGACHVSALTA